MDWIKKNYEQAIVIALSVILLAISVLLILRVMDFQSVFAGIQGQVAKSTKIDPVDVESIQAAHARLAEPSAWTSGAKSQLFVPERWVLAEGTLKPVTDEGMINPPIRNEWLIEHGLELLDPDVLTQDPDRDGFTNLEEWLGGVDDPSGERATKPTDKNSHPPLTTKLFLKEYKEEPFYIVFKAQPDPDTFQINIPGRRSQFVKVGDVIEGAKKGSSFKVVSFEPKTITLDSGAVSDVSELKIQDVETAKEIDLIKGRVVDSPDSYVVFKYLWNDTEFRKTKDDVFTLAPDEATEYKVIDIAPQEAQIENVKTGERLKIPKLPQAK